MTEGKKDPPGRLAFTCSGDSPDSPLDPRFGRCAYFVIYDERTGSWETVENGARALGNGAGIQAAQDLASRGITGVVTGDVGPNAYRVLSAAGIRVFVDSHGTPRSALAEYMEGKLKEACGPTGPGHHGKGPAGAWRGSRWQR